MSINERKTAITTFLLVICLLSICFFHGCNDNPSSYDVIVIGAGIAGLTAAYYLSEEDYDIKVLEKNDYVGGRALSGNHNGFTYAKGTEYLGVPEGALKGIIDGINLKPKEIPAPMDATYHNGTFYWGEDGLAWMYISTMGADALKQFVATILDLDKDYEEIPNFSNSHNPAFAELENKTANAWYGESVWYNSQPLADIIQETLNTGSRGLFGAGIDEISALSYIPEIAFDYSTDMLDEFDEIDEEDNTPEEAALYNTESYSFVTGIAEIPNAIAYYLGSGVVQLNATVTSVTSDGENYVVTYTDENENSHSLTSEAVILAVPAPVALEIASTVLNTEQKNIMNLIPYAPYITTALFSKEPIFDKAFDLGVPDGYFFTDVYDGTWVQREYDDSVSNNTDTYIVSIYVAPEGYLDPDQILEMSDEEILERIYKDWQGIFTAADTRYIKRDIENIITGYDIHRFTYAYPVMIPGAYPRLMELNRLNQDSTLLLAGDYMIYPTFEAAAESGLLAAEYVMEELGLNSKR